MFVLNFYSPVFIDQLKRGRKTATIRLGNKSKKYRKGEVVMITVGFQHSPRERIFEAVIDSVEVKKVSELSRRDIEHDNPEFRRLDEMVHFLEQIYGRKVDQNDDVTVVRFSQISDRPSEIRERLRPTRPPRTSVPPPWGFGTPGARVPSPALRMLECQESAVRTPRRRFLRMKLKPLGDRVIVKAIEEEETTASGIVLPDTAKEKPQRGKVLAAGDGRWDEDGEKRIPLDVAEGDEVLYSKYGGTEIVVEGEDLLVLRESDVLAKVG